MPGDRGDQAVEATLDFDGALAGLVAQDVSGPMHPAIGAFDIRPECGGALQTAADQLAEPRERRRGPPFSATRSRLSATASSRALSRSPEAASGGGAPPGGGRGAPGPGPRAPPRPAGRPP